MKINCDLGEGQQDIDTLLLPLVDQASIACGAHAGDEDSIYRCLTLAKQSRTEAGIHPSYPDRKNFGRESLAISPEDLQTSLEEQIQRFLTVSHNVGYTPTYIKAHGALYNDLGKHPHLCECFFPLIAKVNHKYEINLAMMLSASMHQPHIVSQAQALNLTLIFEAFADRAYQADGSLVSRKIAGSVFDNADKILAQYQNLKQYSSVICDDKTRLKLHADSVCFHGDNPASVRAILTLRNSSCGTTA